MFNYSNEDQQQVSANPSQQEPAASKILLLGYGNVDRQDDGIAWHILRKVATNRGVQLPEVPDQFLYEVSSSLTIGFALHLIPEHAEWLSRVERVLFIDAHTGSIPQEISFTILSPQFEPSPFTHHLTPSTCLALCSALYHTAPQAALLSVRGYDFNFSQSLSPFASQILDPAVERVVEWLG
ncbi:MAG: hypothetical protein AB1457_01100 [Chloroflexota bacterium]